MSNFFEGLISYCLPKTPQRKCVMHFRCWLQVFVLLFSKALEQRLFILCQGFVGLVLLAGVFFHLIEEFVCNGRELLGQR